MKNLFKAITLVVILVAVTAGLGSIHLIQNKKQINYTQIPGRSVEKLSQPQLVQAKKPLITKKARILNLNKNNTLILRGPVTAISVAKLQQQAAELSSKLSASQDIYLVLDTPGGSVVDGMFLIDFLKALPQKIHTVNLFAASMGFQIAMNLNKRYTLTAATYMSHRASIRGLGGEIDGELDVRYANIKRMIYYMENIAANRMGIDVNTYRGLIRDEYWVNGFDSVNEKVADEVIFAKCDKSLDGSYEEEVRTMFGTFKVTLANCPLITGPLKIDMNANNLSDEKSLQNYVNLLYSNKKSFVRKYIVNGEIFSILK